MYVPMVTSSPATTDRPDERRRSQAERRRGTREALLAAGRRLFGTVGVAAVSTAAVVAEAGVTRGALYHHFRDKDDLFRAVYEQLESELCTEITAAVDDAAGAAEGLVRGVGAFLDASDRPEVRRIALDDAPAVLGWETWRRIQSDHALGVLVERLRRAEHEGAPLPGPAEVVAPLLFAAVVEAALTVSASDDRVAARARVEPALHGVTASVLGLAGVGGTG